MVISLIATRILNKGRTRPDRQGFQKGHIALTGLSSSYCTITAVVPRCAAKVVSMDLILDAVGHSFFRHDCFIAGLSRTSKAQDAHEEPLCVRCVQGVTLIYGLDFSLITIAQKAK